MPSQRGKRGRDGPILVKFLATGEEFTYLPEMPLHSLLVTLHLPIATRAFANPYGTFTSLGWGRVPADRFKAEYVQVAESEA